MMKNLILIATLVALVATNIVACDDDRQPTTATSRLNEPAKPNDPVRPKAEGKKGSDDPCLVNGQGDKLLKSTKKQADDAREEYRNQVAKANDLAGLSQGVLEGESKLPPLPDFAKTATIQGEWFLPTGVRENADTSYGWQSCEVTTSTQGAAEKIQINGPKHVAVIVADVLVDIFNNKAEENKEESWNRGEGSMADRFYEFLIGRQLRLALGMKLYPWDENEDVPYFSGFINYANIHILEKPSMVWQGTKEAEVMIGRIKLTGRQKESLGYTLNKFELIDKMGC